MHMLQNNVKIYLFSWLIAMGIVMVFFTLQTIFVVNHFEPHYIIAPVLLGTVIGLLLGAVMTLRKELFLQRELFRTIADLSTNFSFYRGIDGTFHYVSPAVEKITGYQPDDFYARPELLRECIHPDDLPIWDDHVHDVDEDGITRPLDIRFIHRNGEVRWLLHMCVGVKDEAGKVKGIRSNNMDITERRQAEEGLRRSQKMDALGKLTGGIAHDFNNMLGIILGYADLLQEALSDQPKLKKYAHEIHHASERGAKLTKKLLAFTRQKISEADMLNLNTLLQDEKHLLEKTLTARIKLVLILAENLWPVWLDSNDLEDAILNMSINAMHAIDGNGQITLQTSNEQINVTDAKLLDLEPGDYVLLNITDTGGGMNDATKEIIFDPFYSTKGENGTGLGLSQVYGFMQRSNGEIKVYSELGHGTQFALYFPRYHGTSHK